MSKLEQHADSGSGVSTGSPFSECPGPTHYAGCACHEKGWQNKWECAVEMAAQAKCKLDEARRMHAYANEQRKAADNQRLNAEETVERLRMKVRDLLKHGLDACEYTDGWEDALLKIRDEFPPENAEVQATTSAPCKPENHNQTAR